MGQKFINIKLSAMSKYTSLVCIIIMIDLHEVLLVGFPFNFIHKHSLHSLSRKIRIEKKEKKHSNMFLSYHQSE